MKIKRWKGSLIVLGLLAAFLIYRRETIAPIFEREYFWLATVIFIGLLIAWFFIEKMLAKRLGENSKTLNVIEAAVTGILALAFWLLFFHL